MSYRPLRSWLLMLTLVGLVSIAGGTYRAVTVISHADVTTQLEITGRFGQPLGKVIAIEGQVIGENERLWKGRDFSKAAVLVTKCNDAALERPITIECSLRDAPQAGTKVRLTGFETGGFTGMSDDVFAWYKSHIGVPQARGWGFTVEFIVLEPSQSPPPPPPSPFSPPR